MAAAAACRRWSPRFTTPTESPKCWRLRLAVLFHHARRAIDAPRITLKSGRAVHFGLSQRWLKRHPLTLHLLIKEREEWSALGVRWRTS